MSGPGMVSVSERRSTTLITWLFSLPRCRGGGRVGRYEALVELSAGGVGLAGADADLLELFFAVALAEEAFAVAALAGAAFAVLLLAAGLAAAVVARADVLLAAGLAAVAA